jgi:regulator of sigma E protease
MMSVIGFMAILGPLVVVHELGHYIFARIFNVRAEVFSIGFGPKLWGRQIGETEWRLSAFPLGGYVKLFGEDRDAELSDAESARALHKQAPWKRFFIFFGGPLFNFIFAILVFMAILVLGEQHPASVIGRVVDGSAAMKFGFRSGDEIQSINGTPVRRFDEVLHKISESPLQRLTFKVLRVVDGKSSEHEVVAVPSTQEGYSVYGEATHVGEIDGIILSPRGTQVGVSSNSSVAGSFGLQTGDELGAWNGRPVKSWEELNSLYSALKPGDGVKLSFKKKGSSSASVEFEFRKGSNAESKLEDDWGLYSTELFVDKTIKDSPAEKAGLKSGDRIVSVSGRIVQSFFELKDGVQRAGERRGDVTLEWERSGQVQRSVITATETKTTDPFLKKVTQYTIGVVPMLVLVEPKTVTEKVLNPVSLIYQGTERMLSESWRNIVTIKKMVTGDVSMGALGGPIMIGKIAGESLSRGIIVFLKTMALLSVGLGVMNVLPIPVLDGGHLMLLGIEAVRGKPLSIRQMEVVQQVGLSLILLLMVVVFKNDLTRLPFFQSTSTSVSK